MTLNRDQLIKLLNLTRSEYDAEALNAIRHADALLRKHGASWADLLALPQEPTKAPQPEPTPGQQQQPRPSPEGSAKFKTELIREPKVRHALLWRLTILFFPYAVFVWLYERVVVKSRRRLKPVAMLVPIFGGTMAVWTWVCLVLAAAQLLD
jgi:hypothetical protein